MQRKIRALSAFCGVGGADWGYHLAGLEIHGIDIAPQPNYPFNFTQADAMEYVANHGHEYDVILGSPPCQGYSTLAALSDRYHPLLIKPFRELCKSLGKPYVIENVEGSKKHMVDPIRLCGSSFGKRIRRHRLFESSFPLEAPQCDHKWQDKDKTFVRRVSKGRGFSQPTGIISVHGGSQLLFDGKSNSRVEHAVAAFEMGIHWATKTELNDAIPPVYTEYLGRQVVDALSGGHQEAA